MARSMLSKALLFGGLQCRKRLWLAVNAPREAVGTDESAEAIFGKTAGKLARGHWPGGICIKPGSTLKAVKQTWREIQSSPRRPLYDAAFVSWDVGVRASILAPAAGAEWELIEVKIAARAELGHVDECAVQAWVIENTGLSLSRISLALIDTDFVYQGDGDYTGLFYLEDITETVKSRMTEVPGWIASLQATVDGSMPKISMGHQCTTPWPCPFQGFCSHQSTKYPVSLLPTNQNGHTASLLQEQGYEDLRDVPVEILADPLNRRVALATQTGEPFLSTGAQDFLADCPYPRYYLSLQTAEFPVPAWRGTRPYQRIPFQWSCHIERMGKQTDHVGFAEIGRDDPSEDCAARLIQTIGDVGPVFTYGTSHKTAIQSLANRLPYYAQALRGIAARVVNVLPLVRDNYYHPAMSGSFAIRDVAATIDPTLDHTAPNVIPEGISAALACWNIATGHPGDRKAARIQRDLDQYSTQETKELMEIVRFLQRIELPFNKDNLKSYARNTL